MNALVKRKVGPGHLALEVLPSPIIGDYDLLIRVSNCGVCGSDLHIEDGVHPCQPPVVLEERAQGKGGGSNMLTILPLSQWREAFDACRARRYVKVLLDPSR